MQVDDNCFLALRSAHGQMAWLHASWTEWKNTVLVRDLRPRRQAGDRRPRRQLRRRAADLLSKCCRRWARRRRRSGNIPAQDQSWDAEFADFVDGDRAKAGAPCGDIARCGRQPRDRRGDLPKVPPMIIVRSPLRITLGGGGTDLPSYYREHGGFLIAAAIDKYVYITVHQTFIDELIVKYSELERVSIDRRAQASDRARGVQAGRARRARARDHLDGRHSGRHRARLVGQLHHRAAQGALQPSQDADPSARAGRAGLPHRDRPAARADRQAGPVHRGVRRRDLLPFQPGRQRRGLAAQGRRRDALQSRRQSAAVLHRLLAQRLVDPQGAGRQDQAAEQRHDRRTCTT